MKPTILVIEDDATTMDLVEMVLSREGYRPLIAFDGLQGLEIARSQAVDLIMLDLMLPGIDGFDVLCRLRADPRTANLPVLIVTVKSQPTDKRAAAKVGADAYLTKPYDIAEMLALIDSLLSEKREKPTTRGPCAIVVGPRRRETTRTVLCVGLALARKGRTTTLVDLHPFSTERPLLPGIPRPQTPISLADPATTNQLAELAVRHHSGLRVLERLEGRGKAGQIASRDMDALLDALLTGGAFVLFSLPLDYPTDVLCQTAGRCGSVLVVAASDPDSLRGAHAALTMIQRSGVDESRIGVVVVIGPMAERELPEFGQQVLCPIPAKAGPDHAAFHDLADWLRSGAQSPPEADTQGTA
jgi:DNA-binding response OmpR family regulator